MNPLNKKGYRIAYSPPDEDKHLAQKLEPSLNRKLERIRSMFSSSADLIIHPVEICGISCAVLLCEGLVNSTVFANILARPLTGLRLQNPTPAELHHWVTTHSILAPDQKQFTTYGELFRFMMSGFALLLIDGIGEGTACGLQGFPGRSISEPEGEGNVRGSREGFAEMLRPNLTLIRRRFKSPDLVFESITVGTRSKTDGALIYLNGAVAPKLLDEMRRRISEIRMDVVLETGYIQPFLDDRPLSLFSGVGVTERPDTLCAKVAEGRVALLLDGTPYAIFVPCLFNEHFQSVDDYSHRPYFATFIRWLKYTSFLFSILLPGLYVALGTFHPELLPQALLEKLAVSEQATPFPLVLEALIIFFVYEIMREAGLRMPKPVGHAVSIIGALVIGDAAVTAGIIGAPMVLVVALTAISSFVAPTLYEPVTFLRFAFILLGGAFGSLGVMLGFCAMVVNMCAVSALGIPVTAPLSPVSLYAMRDVLFRWSWRTLAKEDLRVSGLTGSTLQSEEDNHADNNP